MKGKGGVQQQLRRIPTGVAILIGVVFGFFISRFFSYSVRSNFLCIFIF